MSKINALPKGLQEFLGNTSQGVNPSDLLPGVRPEFDMFPFWASDKTVIESNNGNVTTVGNTVALAVPAGEVWMPIQITASMTGLTIGDVVRFSVGIVTPDGLALQFNESQKFTATAVVDRHSISHALPLRTLVQADHFFVATIQEIAIAAGSEELVLTMQFIRMKA